MPSYSLPIRAAVVTLMSASVGRSSAEVARLTGMPARNVRYIFSRAVSRGFIPDSVPLNLLDKHIEDAPRKGRPTKQTEENVAGVLDFVRTNQTNREKSCAQMSESLKEIDIHLSPRTINRILKKHGFRKTKPTRKPGLTEAMKKQRLAWCLEHESWTLEDWKRVIWTDETSVVLGHRRGGYRIWRQPQERFLKSCIHRRWKGYSEFMFWGSFSWDMKGPSHCFLPETPADSKIADATIRELNKEYEPEKKAEWELATGLRRLQLRQLKGRKPTWRYSVKTGKLERSKKGGIDWYRYQKDIILPKIIPFAKELEKSGLGVLVQEDNAPCHSHWIQQRVYDLHEVSRLLWCPNSPDLNPIECAWWWMKKKTSRLGRLKSRAEAILAWNEAWKELSQQQIQAWIERIMKHIKQVIALNGGNEYPEGRRFGRVPNPSAALKLSVTLNRDESVDSEWADIDGGVVEGQKCN